MRNEFLAQRLVVAQTACRPVRREALPVMRRVSA